MRLTVSSSRIVVASNASPEMAPVSRKRSESQRAEPQAVSESGEDAQGIVTATKVAPFLSCDGEEQRR